MKPASSRFHFSQLVGKSESGYLFAWALWGLCRLIVCLCRFRRLFILANIRKLSLTVTDSIYNYATMGNRQHKQMLRNDIV
jgi:hypothetical protein